jgi:uncharacterized protein (TIGR03435 family)
MIKGKSTMSRLADVLADSLGFPIVDVTGLTGVFTVDLNWARDDNSSTNLATNAGQPNLEPSTPAPTGINGPSIFAALQDELGLRLVTKKVPTTLLVIDHADTIPTEN